MLLVLLLGLTTLPWQGLAAPQTGTPAPAESIPSVVFVENVGQFDESVLFRAQTHRGMLFIVRDSIRFSMVKIPEELTNPPENAPPDLEFDYTLEGTNLRLTFPGSNPDARITPLAWPRWRREATPIRLSTMASESAGARIELSCNEFDRATH